MKIGIISDTHGTFDKVLQDFLQPCDEVWCAGDFGTTEVADKIAAFKPLRAVYGNIDGEIVRRMYGEFCFFEVEGVKVLMTHIGGYPRKYAPKALQHIHGARPKIFVAGHSHILKVIYDPIYDLLHINPGAAGKYGIHKVRTAVRFDIEAGEIKNMEIGEWEKGESF
ncbi:MAG: metallophosphoesterase family protein [Rikenellaceae bacterium]|nr:metallophosphoesterase family protein [Rikenellaceae bacterium]